MERQRKGRHMLLDRVVFAVYTGRMFLDTLSHCVHYFFCIQSSNILKQFNELVSYSLRVDWTIFVFH